ncbi:hypothetical protein GOARA_040_00080 [Gordonia araii NBRC 100433]|uniref:Uncharacterized protein n=1 Tax=Gordonia araii NBRC 100433 TaxID=1073574 RepID=G7H0V8_9ACTN|nr:hypothetical protein GOARA_040_00080 [Gordonia araii NBRC 100433]
MPSPVTFRAIRDTTAKFEILDMICVTLVTGATSSWSALRLPGSQDEGKWEIMATTQVTDSDAVRVRMWRVLSMLSALVAVVVGLVVITISAV